MKTEDRASIITDLRLRQLSTQGCRVSFRPIADITSVCEADGMNPWQQRQSELAQHRVRVDHLPGEFGLGDVEPDGKVLSAALHELQTYLFEKDLVLEPSDRLDWLLGLDPDEATDAMERVVAALGHDLPGHPYHVSQLTTVSDFVREVRGYVATKESG